MGDGSENGGGDRGQDGGTERGSDGGDGQSDSSGQGKDGQSGQRSEQKQGSGQQQQSGQQRQASTIEKVVIAVSVTFTVLLFAYAGWQIVTTPQATTPEATVVGTERLDSGDVAVTVRLRNPRDVGLVTATVESDCASPPAEVQLSYVPASTTRTATLVCPPGTTDPTVSVANWVSR